MYRKDGAEFEVCRPEERRYLTARLSSNPGSPGPASCHARSASGAARFDTDDSENDSDGSVTHGDAPDAVPDQSSPSTSPSPPESPNAEELGGFGFSEDEDK